MKKPEIVFQYARLLVLADYLAKLKNQFDLNGWVQVKIGGQEYLDPKTLKKVKGNPTWSVHKACGTVACAVGHAPSIPEFKKAGLKLGVSDQDEENGGVLQPVYKDLDGWEAVEKFFGIDSATAEALFLGTKYEEDQRKDPKAVAARIYELLSDPVNFDTERNIHD